MKITLTILLTLTMFSVMGQTKICDTCETGLLNSKFLSGFRLSDFAIDTNSIATANGSSFVTMINAPKPLIAISQADKNGNYTIHFNHKQLKWLNDSTAIYITTPSKKRYVNGFNHSKLK